MSKIKIGILTSGGDAPGMNATLYYLNKYLSNHNLVYFKNGFKGLCNNEIFNGEFESAHLNLAGSIIGTSRYKEFKSNVQQAIDVLKTNKIELLIIIGGNGSFQGAKDLIENNINILFIPATIDNDVEFSEYSLGFSSALNEVHVDLIKLTSTFKAHNNICLVEVMGRTCPNISIMSSLSYDLMFSLNKNRKMTTSDLVKRTSEYYNKNQYGIGVIAEYTYSDDEINHILTRINNNCKCEVRYCKLGHLQRGANVDYIDIRYANMFAYFAMKLISKKTYNHAIYLKNGTVQSSLSTEVEKVQQITDLEKEMFEYDFNKD